MFMTDNKFYQLILECYFYIVGNINIGKYHCFSFLRPMFEYACALWDGCSQQDSDNLEKLQLEAGRIVTGLPLFANRESIYSEAGWELLSDR
jgi:hypothetical protein